MSCINSHPWKVTEKFSILISRDLGWTANDPVHALASAFNLASASSFAHNASAKKTKKN